MQLLGFFTSPPWHPCRSHLLGFTLVELVVCLGVLSLMASLAIPSWQRVQERNRIEATRDQLMSDLQAARLRAIQGGEPLQLTRLRDCAWAISAGNDWRCGWQLVSKADQTVLQTTQLHIPLQVTFAKTDPLDISPRGDLGAIGDRWVIKSNLSTLNIANVVCLSSAGRLRWQLGESCGS